MYSFAPEAIVLLTGFVILAYDLIIIKGDNAKAALYLSLSGLAVSTGLTIGLGTQGVETWLKLTLLVSTFLTLAFAAESFAPQAQKKLRSPGEFHTLILFCLAGMMFLASSRDIVNLFVSLELATIPLFLLVAWSKNEPSGEGALKYLLTGAAASAVLLYGLGLLYGLTGEANLAAIGAKVVASPALWLAAGLVMTGVGFKLALFPFHMWAPDTYDGAPIAITTYLSIASKVAGLALFLHIYYRLFSGQAAAFALPIALIAAATMTMGNVAAIRQSRIKRFMAYSSISQAGYLLLGFLGGGHEAAAAVMYYIVIYALTSLAAFAVIIWLVHAQGIDDLEGFAGLSQTRPWLALAMMIALFGLAGIPPFGGFVGKFFLFSMAARSGYYWLVTLAALNSTASLYYYLRIVRQMYMEAPKAATQASATTAPPGWPLRLGLGFATFGSAVIGLVPAVFERIDAEAIYWLTTLHLPGAS